MDEFIVIPSVHKMFIENWSTNKNRSEEYLYWSAGEFFSAPKIPLKFLKQTRARDWESRDIWRQKCVKVNRVFRRPHRWLHEKRICRWGGYAPAKGKSRLASGAIDLTIYHHCSHIIYRPYLRPANCLFKHNKTVPCPLSIYAVVCLPPLARNIHRLKNAPYISAR